MSPVQYGFVLLLLCSRTKASKKNDPCNAPVDPGPCNFREPMFHYDPQSNTCRKFMYGGCLGSSNRFSTEKKCEDTCLRTERRSICEQPKKTGRCPGVNVQQKRWFFDQREGRCRYFRYSGCNGNDNNFISKKKCILTCERLKHPGCSKCKMISAYCVVEKGEVTCVCRKGFHKDTLGHCVDSNSIGTDENVYTYEPHASCTDCDTFATCDDGACRCLPGYLGDGTQCEAIRSTYTSCGANMCHPDATCESNRGGEYCQCRAGFAGNGAQCSRDPAVCQQLFDKKYRDHCGPADWVLMYYFEHGECRAFWYGGCNGWSDNIFPDRNTCDQLCKQGLSPFDPTPRPGPPSVETVSLVSKDKPVVQGTSFAHCMAPKSVGYRSPHCRDLPSSRWYFSVADSSCHYFWYNGCGGSRNNFLSEWYCRHVCIDRVQDRIRDVEAELGVHNKSRCHEPKREGHCMYMGDSPRTRYYYDTRTRTCKTFKYNGCNGNGNKFGTKYHCKKTCSGVRRRPPKMPIHTSPCQLPSDCGPCTDFQLQWFYNVSSGLCERFFYGGCGGNPNRFDRQQDCVDKCDRVTPYQNPCDAPVNRGSCSAHLRRYYYNSTAQSCLQFHYRGCGSSPNNFASLNQCASSCLRHP